MGRVRRVNKLPPEPPNFEGALLVSMLDAAAKAEAAGEAYYGACLWAPGSAQPAVPAELWRERDIAERVQHVRGTLDEQAERSSTSAAPARAAPAAGPSPQSQPAKAAEAPDVRRFRNFTEHESRTVAVMRVQGREWHEIEQALAGRTVKNIKNHWYNHVKQYVGWYVGTPGHTPPPGRGPAEESAAASWREEQLRKARAAALEAVKAPSAPRVPAQPRAERPAPGTALPAEPAPPVGGTRVLPGKKDGTKTRPLAVPPWDKKHFSEEWSSLVWAMTRMPTNNAGPVRRLAVHAADLAREARRPGAESALRALAADPNFKSNVGAPLRKGCLELLQSEEARATFMNGFGCGFVAYT